MKNKWRYSYEDFIKIVGAFLCISYGILEAAGVINWFKPDTVIYLILSFTATILLILITDRPSLKKIEKLLKDDRVSTMEMLLNDLDPNVKKIFHEDIQNNLRFYKDAVNKSVIRISNKDSFSNHYRNSLGRHEKANIYATSLPSKEYFWDNDIEKNSVERGLKNFIENGGNCFRVFLLKHSNEINEPDVKETLEFQKKHLGVNVYTVLKEEVEKKYRNQFFVVFDKCNFAWCVEADLTNKDNITEFQFTIDKNLTNEFMEVFHNIEKLPTFKKY